MKMDPKIMPNRDEHKATSSRDVPKGSAQPKMDPYIMPNRDEHEATLGLTETYPKVTPNRKC